MFSLTAVSNMILCQLYLDMARRSRQLTLAHHSHPNHSYIGLSLKVWLNWAHGLCASLFNYHMMKAHRSQQRHCVATAALLFASDKLLAEVLPQTHV